MKQIIKITIIVTTLLITPLVLIFIGFGADPPWWILASLMMWICFIAVAGIVITTKTGFLDDFYKSFENGVEKSSKNNPRMWKWENKTTYLVPITEEEKKVLSRILERRTQRYEQPPTGDGRPIDKEGIH